MKLMPNEIVAFSQQNSKEFTSYDVAKYFGCTRHQARNAIIKSIALGRVRWTGRKIIDVNKGSKNPLSVYVICDGLPIVKSKKKAKYKNVMDVIVHLGHDEDYKPEPTTFVCVDLPGSLGRIETYRRRVEQGEEIFSEDDVKNGFVRNGEIPDCSPEMFGSIKQYSVNVSKRGAVATRCA